MTISVTRNKDMQLDAVVTELEQSWPVNKAQFDEAAWLNVCDRLAAEASAGCGLSYDVYVQNFSAFIEGDLGNIPQTHHQ